jgi:Flp pilus assembly protein TadG
MRSVLSGLNSRLSALTGRIRSLSAAEGGVAAVEFAFVLPVMVAMYLGMTELTFAINTDRKITLLSRTLADLTGRATKMNQADLDTIYAAAAAVMSPYKSDTASMRISSIVVKKIGGTDDSPVLQGKICWSKLRGSAFPALNPGDVVNVPEGFKTKDTSYVRAEVTMAYSPVFGSGILQWLTGRSGITFLEETPWPVRNVSQIVWDGTPAC